MTSVITEAPGTRALTRFNIIAKQITDAEKKSRIIALRKGVLYILAKHVYEGVYRPAVIRAGAVDPDNIMTLDDFRRSQGFKWDSAPHMSQHKTVVERYILEYGMAEFSVKNSETGEVLQAGLSLNALITVACDVDSTGDDHFDFSMNVDPLLTAMAGYRLKKLMKYHTSKDQAVEMLKQAASIKQQRDFFKWLAEKVKGDPKSIADDLNREFDDEEIDEPTHYKVKQTAFIDQWELRQLGWQSAMSRAVSEIVDSIQQPHDPETIMRGFSITVEVEELET